MSFKIKQGKLTWTSKWIDIITWLWGEEVNPRKAGTGFWMIKEHTYVTLVKDKIWTFI